MSIKRGLFATLFALSLSAGSVTEAAEASAAASVAVAVDVSAAGKAAAALGDKAYAAGDFRAALAAYGEAFAKTHDAAIIYAEAQCHNALEHKAEAEAMFKMYLAAAGSAKLKYENEAKAALSGAKSVGKKVLGGITGVVTGTVGLVADLTLGIAGGIYGVLKLSIAAELEGAAKVKAEAADAAYAAAKWGDAAKNYGAAFFSSENPIALFAQAQAEAQAGNAAAARSLIAGYLQAGAKGKHVEEAKQLLLAMGGSAEVVAKLAVKAKVAKDIAADVDLGDVAYKAGKYLTASKAYAAAYAKKAEPVLLYAKGMAEFSAGQLVDARKDLSAYLAAGGKLDFKVSADVTLKACAGAGA